MRLDEYSAQDGVGLSRLLASGEVMPTELGACVAEAVAALNPALNAVVELYGDALDALPEQRSETPFGGIPVLTKDSLVERGRPAEFGSRLTEGLKARHDKAYWARLRAGGLVNVGRTTSSEFGVAAATESPLYGATHNPWRLGAGVAGSSGGAGAVVAAGIVPFAQGGDAGGSIRNPAAFCGLIGLKPSRGRVSGAPAANAPLFGLATAFMLTRSVRDTALLLDLCHGPEAGDGFEIPPPPRPYASLIEEAPPRELRIALCVEAWSGYPVHPELAAAVRATAATLEDLGHHVQEASPNFDYHAFFRAQKVIWGADSAASLPPLAKMFSRPLDESLLGSTVLTLYRFGVGISAAELVEALSVYDSVTRGIGPFLVDYDILLTPTATILPEPIGTFDPNREGIGIDEVFSDMEPKESFTSLFNATGQPAISLPIAMSADGLPIGAQLVSGFGRDDILLRVARQLEEAAGSGPGIWNHGLPPIHAARARAS